MNTLTIIQPQENGAVRLSDQKTYLVLKEHQPIAARWQVGQLVRVTQVPLRHDEFDLRPADDSTDAARAKRFET